MPLNLSLFGIDLSVQRYHSNGKLNGNSNGNGANANAAEVAKAHEFISAAELASLPVITPPAHLPLESHADDTPQRKALIEQVQALSWYHSIDLPYGVTTPGAYDHRPAHHLYGLPDDLQGKSALDVAMYDGYWAFALERAGAKRVVGIDLLNRSEWDIPPTQREKFLASGHEREMGAAFKIAHNALNSKVERHNMNVYKLSPEAIHTELGTEKFDFVFCGDLLIHLRDPNLALQNICAVTGEMALFVEPFDAALVQEGKKYQVTYLGAYNRDLVWWMPSPEVWRAMILGAGFSRVEMVNEFRLDFPGGREGQWRVVYRAYK